MVKKIALCASIFCCSWLEAYAADSIGMVVAAQGNVYAQSKAGVRRPLERRSEFYLNELIETQENSSAQLKLMDETIISLKPNTKYNVSEFTLNPKDPKSNSYVGNLATGALISMSGQGKESKHLLKTPVATIAIRGTFYGANIDFVKKACAKNTAKLAVKPPCKEKYTTAIFSSYVARGIIEMFVHGANAMPSTSFIMNGSDTRNNATVITASGALDAKGNFNIAPNIAPTVTHTSTAQLPAVVAQTTTAVTSTNASGPGAPQNNIPLSPTDSGIPIPTKVDPAGVVKTVENVQSVSDSTQQQIQSLTVTKDTPPPININTNIPIPPSNNMP